LYKSIIRENTKVIALAMMMGMLAASNPNKSHNNVPKVKREYIYNDMPEVSFV
jgi:hypothetical protein